MILSRDDLFDILQIRIAENAPHRDYQRTVDHAKWCKQIITGDDQKEILVSYKVRETENQVDQRVRITNSRTQYVSNKVKKLFNEVHRADDVTEAISFEGSNQDKLTDLQKAIDSFYENKPLRKYIATRFKDLVFEDPNAYVIVEFDNDDPINKKPTVYPFEVRASEVYFPHYINGVLQYLITFHSIEYETKKKGKVTGNKYTMYGVGWSFVMQHIPSDAVFEIPEGWQSFKMNVSNMKGPQLFMWKDFETKTMECMAFRTGYIDDAATDGRTKVNPMYSAKNILTDLIWNKSEYDLSKALHGFYQKFVFANQCKPCDGRGWQEDRENEGRQIQCDACKGSGKDIHTTTQDIIAITMPNDPTQLWDLSKLVYYAQIPDSLITKQREDFTTDQKDVFNCIFGANVLERSEIVETATAKTYDWRAVNNTLFEYADHTSDFYKFAVRLAASHRMESDGLIVNHSYPHDFKLESIQEKIDQRSSASTAGVPMAIITALDIDILGKQHKDDPEFIKAYKAKERFRPMRDKGRDERTMLINTLSQDDPEKVLYLYYERIMDDIFDENPTFPDMPYKKQREIVYKKVADIIAEKAKNRPTLQMAFANTDEEE